MRWPDPRSTTGSRSRAVAPRELEQAVGLLSSEDREFIARALAAKHDPNTGHSGLDLAKTTFWHPVKVAEHVGRRG
jgi:hypothetical protein